MVFFTYPVRNRASLFTPLRRQKITLETEKREGKNVTGKKVQVDQGWRIVKKIYLECRVVKRELTRSPNSPCMSYKIASRQSKCVCECQVLTRRYTAWIKTYGLSFNVSLVCGGEPSKETAEPNYSLWTTVSYPELHIVWKRILHPPLWLRSKSNLWNHHDVRMSPVSPTPCSTLKRVPL